MVTRWVGIVAGVVAGGLFVAGCSSSSSRGGGATTTAPVSSGTTSTTTSTSSPIPQAPPSQGTGLDAFNVGLQRTWDALRPGALSQLDQVIAQQLNRQLFSNPTLSVEVLNANVSQRSDLVAAPGATHLSDTRLAFRAPLRGTWQLILDAQLRVTLNLGGVSPAIDIPVEIALDDLSLEVEAELDQADPTRPVVKRVGQPVLDFVLRIDSQNAIAQQLLGVLSAPANWIAQQALVVVLQLLAPNLQGLQGLPGAVPADGAPPLVDSGTAVPFEEVTENVELKLRQVNQPHGMLLFAIMDTPASDSWLDAYRNGGAGLQGSVVDYEDGGDAAIWTGQYLGAQALRYAATGSALAHDSIGHTLKGIGALLDVNGGTGLLARNAAPETSLAGQRILGRGAFRSAQLHGETWVGWQGDNGISRDQYSGVVFGLSLAYEHVPSARAECQYRLEQILDYLIAKDWVVDEDRPAYGTPGSRGPTFWAGGYQQLAFLLAAHRANPAKYAQQVAQAGPQAETAWLRMWINTFGLDHYYKFNLAHIGMDTYFRLETDASRWQSMRRAYTIMERVVGHHRNAHFDLIQTRIDPSTQTPLYGSIREAMREFVRDTNHRKVAPAVVDLSGITWVSVPQVGYANTGGFSFTLQTTQAQFPSEPLPMKLRAPQKHFVWQRTPFSPATPNQGDPRVEKMGLDLVLPYWMGRYVGAF